MNRGKPIGLNHVPRHGESWIRLFPNVSFQNSDLSTQRDKEIITDIFTLSFHYLGRRSKLNHIDLFLKTPEQEQLVHFSIPLRQNTDNHKIGCCFPAIAVSGRPHRLKYLTYSGVISNGRGKVRQLLNGIFEAPRLTLIKARQPGFQAQIIL